MCVCVCVCIYIYIYIYIYNIAFPSHCLHVPKRGGHRRNLATMVNQAVREEKDVVPESSFKQHQARDIDPAKHLAARVAGKLEEGDFHGAVRFATSDESFATEDDKTLLLLQRKHPPAHPDSQIPPIKSPSIPLSVTSSIVIKAISSFPSGSAAGPDRLHPQHLN